MTGCIDYRMSRRSMLAASGAASGLLLGMNVPSLLAAAGKDLAAKAEHVILFRNGGGMSHIDTFDPKPGRPTGGELAPINTSASGVQISEIFPQLAKQMHHCSIIRSVAGTQGDHGRASHHAQQPGGCLALHQAARLLTQIWDLEQVAQNVVAVVTHQRIGVEHQRADGADEHRIDAQVMHDAGLGEPPQPGARGREQQLDIHGAASLRSPAARRSALSRDQVQDVRAV